MLFPDFAIDVSLLDVKLRPHLHLWPWNVNSNGQEP